MVHSREDVVGLDASIVMHPRVWQASGHLANFSDPLVDCKVCGERFRADKAPRVDAGADAPITLADKGRAKAALERVGTSEEQTLERKGKVLHGAKVGERGYVCTNCGSPFLSDERQFNLMFRTSLGPVDPVADVISVMREAIASGEDDTGVRKGGRRLIGQELGVPAPRDRAGHVRQLPQRAAEHGRQAPAGHRPDGQELS